MISPPFPVDSVRDAYPMGFSEPSGILCARTAPIPYAEASHASVSGSVESKCVRKLSEVSRSFDA